MTFLEAAIEVLRSAEEPLHFNQIAKLAVERKLLSHVGRDPEAAMRSCLNSAVRSKVHDGLVMRSKPGHYRLRPGVEVPELPPAPSEPAPLPEVEPAAEVEAEPKSKKSKKSTRKTSKSKKSKKASKTSKSSGSKSKKVSSGTSKSSKDEESARDEAKASEPAQTSLPMPELNPDKVRFRGPEGSGLEGETDITLVMANAMSRLVEERPELREELEAMQKGQAPAPEVIEVGRKRRRDESDDRRSNSENEERGGRRRRRRRRRSRRVDWSESTTATPVDGAQSTELLNKVAAVLGEAGGRSLHIRQIAENLAAQNVLGGEISEIERAATAAVLLDVHRRGEASRFAIRGDARYQLRGGRLPEKAASAEHTARAAIATLEDETSRQLLLWLQSLGVRALESLVRVWLEREEHTLVATLPPSRGLGKLIVDDPDADEDEGRTLTLIVPRKTSLEPKLWDGEAERHNCNNTLVFAMCDPINETGETRVIFAPEFARWLLRHGIGVRRLRVDVPVLDADLIESIGGLDT